MTQPQWPRNFPLRDYVYTHTQPQWSPMSSVVLRNPLAPTRVCSSCGQPKERCTCVICACCKISVGIRTVRRHHCRNCWRAVCSNCWTKIRHIHMLGNPVKVCDICAVPRGISFICRKQERSLMWGIYILMRAAEMPMICITPTCKTFTYQNICRKCGLPTVTTRPHDERLIRFDTRNPIKLIDTVKYLDAKECSVRAINVDKYSEEEVEKSFRLCFPLYQEISAFNSLNSSTKAHDLLLSLVCAAISYEYENAPSLTLSLSDLPYSRLLKLIRCTSRYSILEAPGKVKFISFPGTHNYRTLTVDLRWKREKRQQWSNIIQGLTISLDNEKNNKYIPINGGIVKTWEYRIHEGFSREADEIALYIGKFVDDVRLNGYRLVFSGHSLGGAVAQLVTLRLLQAHPGLLKDKIKCISFGAPLVGNYQLAQYVERCGWRSNFHNIIYRSDLIPRLLCADQITRDLADQFILGFNSIQNSLQKLFFSSNSSTNNESTEIIATIDNNIKESKDLIEVEEISLQSKIGHRAHRMYACFGHYHFLNHSGVEYFSTDDSEIAFHRLKSGCGGDSNYRDHFISTYNRAIMLYLYTR